MAEPLPPTHGGSTIERCGDRQPKFDGLWKRPLYLFIESLSVALRIPLLLTCGLSRHMWLINTSVACVVTAFTVFVFYDGIVVARVSSHDCPFQTPSSTALRALRDGGVFQMLFARPLLAALRESVTPQNSLANPPAPRIISLIRVTWRWPEEVLFWSMDGSLVPRGIRHLWMSHCLVLCLGFVARAGRSDAWSSFCSFTSTEFSGTQSGD